MLNFNKTHFIISAPHIGTLPPESGIEIAFIGRSNAGKSSALNAITNIRNLAKTSKTPGRTQQINLFEVQEGCRIVDLPGYGFAKVPLAVKNKWQQSLTEYLQKRKCLRALVLIMDIRHPLKDLDRQVMTWAAMSNLEVLILLTKSDKLGINEQKKTLAGVKKSLVEFGASYRVVIFSSLNKTGVDEVRQILSGYYETFHGFTQEEAPSAAVTEAETAHEPEHKFDEEAWNKYSQD